MRLKKEQRTRGLPFGDKNTRRRIMNYQEIAKEILDNIGGETNVGHATHCLTRLRITYKDKGLINDEAIKSIPGLIGTKYLGTQYQVIIGPNVENVYKEFCKLAHLQETARINVEEEEDKTATVKEKFTWKKLGNEILETIAACVTPMISVITLAGLLKMIVALLGPNMLNLVDPSQDFMRLLTFVGDCGFYFMPIFAAYASAKRFGTNIQLSIFLACVLLHPTLVEIVKAGEPFHVYGIPMTLTTYSTSFIPILLIVWAQSYVEKFLNKVLPSGMKSMVLPLLLTLIMLPIGLCFLGPIGSILGKGIAEGFVTLNTILGPFSIAIVGALWPIMISTGLHQAVLAIALQYIATYGYDSAILVGSAISVYVLIALALAYTLKIKDVSERNLGMSALITKAFGGVSEPTIFGIMFRYKKALFYTLVGGFVGGLYAGIMHVYVYLVTSGNLLCISMFTGGNTSNLVNGIVASAIAFIVTFVMAMIFGFDDSKKIFSKKEKK